MDVMSLASALVTLLLLGLTCSQHIESNPCILEPGSNLSSPRCKPSNLSSHGLLNLQEFNLAPERSELLTKLMWMEEQYLKISEHFVDWSWPKILNMLTKSNISGECLDSFEVWWRDLGQGRLWAVKMLDASGKFPTGFLDGSVADLGSFTLCTSPGHSNVPVKGQYCSVHFYPPRPRKERFYTMFHQPQELADFGKRDNVIAYLAHHVQLFQFIPLRLGLCLPAKCTSNEIQSFMSTAASGIELTAALQSCEDGELKSFSRQQKTIVFLIGILLCAVLLGTALDLFKRQLNVPPTEKSTSLTLEVLQAFSVVSNFEKLTSTSTASDDLRVLHGIRVLTISWVILGHSYLFVHKFLFRNLLFMKEGTKSLAFQLVSNATTTVDTFFFISGLLTTYVTLKIMRTHNVKFSVPLYVFHRYWRLTPTYAVVIGLSLLLPSLSSGPVWKEAVEPLAEKCRTSWWMNLLYINNIITPSSQCLAHSWYLPADFQFHLLSLLFMVPFLSGRKWLAVMANVGLATVSMLVTGIITYVYNFPPTELYIHPDEDDRMEMKSLVYYQFYAHTGAYCIGLALGCYLAQRSKTFVMPKVYKAAGWSLCFLMSFLVLFSTYPWNNGDLPGPGVAALYAATHRTIWSASLAWVVFACVTGNGGIINMVLTWRPLVPLSRLTFLAYLVHPQIQWIFTGLAHERIFFSNYNMMYIFIGHMVMTYLVSMVMSVMFEAPFLALEKLLFLRNKDTLKGNAKCKES